MTETSDFILSIKPVYAHKILSGEKTVELRRKFPVDNVSGKWILIYSSLPDQAIIGAAEIRNVERLPIKELWVKHKAHVCINKIDFDNYYSGLDFGLGIVLRRVVKFDNSISVEELKSSFSFHPPQSYRYVKGKLLQLLYDSRVQIPIRHEYCDWPRGQSPSRRALIGAA